MRLSIGKRIFLAVVLIQILSAILIVGWYFYTVNVDLRDLSRTQAQEATVRAVDKTRTFFTPPRNVARLTGRLLSGNVLRRADRAGLERYLFEQLRRVPQIAGIFIGYPDGSFHYVMRSDEASPLGSRTKFVERSEESRSVELIWRDREFAEKRRADDPSDAYDPRTRGWYKSAVEKRRAVWTEPYIFFTSRKPGITAAVPVFGGEGETVAVVGVDVEMTEVSRFLSQVGFGSGGSAFIVGPQDEVIAHRNAAFAFTEDGKGGLRFRKAGELPGADGALAGTASDDATTVAVALREYDGKDYFVASKAIGEAEWPWRVTAIVPAAGFFRVLSSSNMLLVAVVLLATAIACALGFVLARGVARPLVTLRGNAVLARNGNYELMDPVTSGYAEVDDTAEILVELAEARRGRGPKA